MALQYVARASISATLICGLASSTLAKEQKLLRVAPGSSARALRPCSDVYGNHSDIKASSVVRVRIPVGFGVAEQRYNVRYRINNDPEDDLRVPPTKRAQEDKEFSLSRVIPLVGTDEYSRNPFSFKISSLKRNSREDPIKVRVYLQDIRYVFGSMKLDTGDVGQGVILPSSEGAMMFCQKEKPIDQNREKSVLTFYVLPGEVMPGSAAYIPEATLNFIVIPNVDATGSDWGTETPILIDPKIKNDG